MDETAGQAAARALARLTGSQQPSPKWQEEAPPIRMPTTAKECAELRRWAETAPVTPEPAATQDELAKHLAFLQATLPSKNVDEDSGKMRVAVYVSVLGSRSNAALAHMARRAVETLHWFPTPRQCIDLLASYRPPASDRATALAMCEQFTQAQFEAWIKALPDSDEIGAVPEQWKRIAVERGILRRMDDGSFVKRQRRAAA